MASDIELAYLAGLIDGEGTITIQKRKPTGTKTRQKNPSFVVVVLVVNTDQRLVQAAKDISGAGYIWQAAADRNPERANWNQVWRYETTAAAARGLIALVQPYLRSKTRQAEIALSMPPRLRGWNARNRPAEDLAIYEQQEVLFLEMKELNRRGRQPSE